jgi:hypothetical protein
MHTAQYVYFNDGTDTNVYALVTQNDGDTKLNLFCIPASGESYVKNGIPQREPNDYGPEGGGDTWHLAPVE